MSLFTKKQYRNFHLFSTTPFFEVQTQAVPFSLWLRKFTYYLNHSQYYGNSKPLFTPENACTIQRFQQRNIFSHIYIGKNRRFACL